MRAGCQPCERPRLQSSQVFVPRAPCAVPWGHDLPRFLLQALTARAPTVRWPVVQLITLLVHVSDTEIPSTLLF